MALHIAVSEAVYSICSLKATKTQLSVQQQGRVGELGYNHPLRLNPRLWLEEDVLGFVGLWRTF
jgi:hypothetical protein